MRSHRFFFISCLAGLWMLSGSTLGAARAQSNDLAEECNQLAAAVNQNSEIMMAFETEINDFAQNASNAETLDEIKSAANQYVVAVGDVTNGLTGLASDLDELSLGDEQLSEYRYEYIVVVAGFNEALTTVATAMSGVAEVESEEQLPGRIETVQAETETAVERINQLSAEEANIVSGVNGHCGIEAE